MKAEEKREQFRAELKYVSDESLNRIEQIVSERITHEQDTIKPYHEHGNSVASDRTESGQSADGGIAIMEILQPIHRHPFDAESGREMEIWYTHKDVWNAMTTYASQVCADKDREIEVIQTDWKNKVDGWIMGYRYLEKELSAANERIAEFEKSMLSLGVIYGKDAEKFKKRHNISIETIDLRKVENGYDINNPKTK